MGFAYVLDDHVADLLDQQPEAEELRLGVQADDGGVAGDADGILLGVDGAVKVDGDGWV